MLPGESYRNKIVLQHL